MNEASSDIENCIAIAVDVLEVSALFLKGNGEKLEFMLNLLGNIFNEKVPSAYQIVRKFRLAQAIKEVK